MMANPIEVWKSEKHPFDVWNDVERYAAGRTPLADIDPADLERMKWHGFFYRKRDNPGRFMTRIRLTANELTALQAREIAFIAFEYGHGIIDITTRANIQIQGLSVEHLPIIAKRLETVGLTALQTGHDNIRNVFGHPFSGLTDHDLIDTRDICREIDDLYLGNREFSDLPRKLNICLNGTEDHPSHFWTQDLSFLATRNADGDVGFQVLIAGTQGQNPRLAWHLPIFVMPDQVAPVTAAIIELFREKGSREKRNNARLRFLLEEIGVSGVLEWLEEKLPFQLMPSIGEPIPSSVTEEFVGWFRQKQSKRWIMGLNVPLGRLSWKQLEGLALLSKKWGDGNLRTTQEQGLAVINIPSGFKGAAATDAAALGLSVYADEFDLNTMACTGSQFCNIAVTETKGQMFHLIEKLRKRALKLHGIRIHMSGCPSSCAQHFTADIGLKGVRVRRLLGTREGYDVFLGGGLAGQVHMALPYRLGVDVDQLPNLVEEVTNEFYQNHKPGQTFSSYWRARLQSASAQKVGDADYHLPVWICEGCQHQHQGEDPPVFCPSCAGLRRLFARIESEMQSPNAISENSLKKAIVRNDGFAFAVNLEEIPEKNGKTVSVEGKEFALFKSGQAVHCIDSACPHEGASLADGEFKNGFVSCPWHNWTFNVCNGCSLEPPGNDVNSYETLIEGDKVFIKTGIPPKSVSVTSGIASLISSTRSGVARAKAVIPVEAELKVVKIIDETNDVKTYRLDNSIGKIPFDFPGKFAKVCIEIEGDQQWRSFTISSSPTRPELLDLTIKLNPSGQVSRALFDTIQDGSFIRIKGVQGGFYFDPQLHSEPLVLISAGSGITPMMSIARYIRDREIQRPVVFLHGARTLADVIFADECQELAARTNWFKYAVSLSQPHDQWTGARGRISIDLISDQVHELSSCRYFLCGPNEFMDDLRQTLIATGVPLKQIHTEQFHKTRQVVTG